VHFFIDTGFTPASGLLCPEESHHATRTLRLREGDSIQVGDGTGTCYTCRIAQVKRDALLLETTAIATAPPYLPHLTLAIAPVKHPARLEWLLEKATELGVNEWVPVLTARTEKSHLNAARMERIVLAAAKQSQRLWLPLLKPLTPLATFLAGRSSTGYIAHCMESMPRVALRDALPATAPASLTVLIGPEGDFTPDEVQQAHAAGYTGVALGPTRLRTETAGIFCVSLLTSRYR
jgi:16S rRNA (uracil1498-N3)-methyltransferase